jgi:hypothetical protein
LRAIVKSQLRDSNKIGVILGGSSVFNGTGQPPSKLWTKHLQKVLGSQYRVVNFAFRGARVQGGGAIAAQSLLNEGYKIIFAADLTTAIDPTDANSPKFFSPVDGGSFYNYFLWDAFYKGFIKIDKRFRQEVDRTEAQKPSYGELKLRMWLDSVFYFSDFWTTVAYKYFFTVWNPIAVLSHPNLSFAQPRSLFSDLETSYPAVEPVPDRYERLEKMFGAEATTNRELGALKRYCQELFTFNGKEWIPNQSAWAKFDYEAQITFPEDFRFNTLLVVTHHSPYYFDKLEPRYKECWNQGTAIMVEHLKKAGYWATDVQKKFTAEDYNDGLHLVPEGGIKLAEAIAPTIREMAKNKGYLK